MGTFSSRPGGSLSKISAHPPALFWCISLGPSDPIHTGLEFDSVYGRPEMEEMRYDFPSKNLLRCDPCPGSIVTELSDWTRLAKGFSCGTGLSAMPDEKIGDMGPLLLGNDLHQVELNLHRVLVLSQTDSLAHSLNMRIDHHRLELRRHCPG